MPSILRIAAMLSLLLLMLSTCAPSAVRATEPTTTTAVSSHTLGDLQTMRSGSSSPGTVMPHRAVDSMSSDRDQTGVGGGISALTPVDSGNAVPTPTPPPRASVDSLTFRLVPSVQCNDTTAGLVMQVYAKNRALFDECVTKGKYQIFPFTGELPTPEQLTTLALVPACTAIFTGVLLSGLPECHISSMALKSVVETLLKVTVDIRAGLPCPDSQQFFDLIIWRRDSNMAQSAGLPYDSASKLYSEYSKNLWKALTTSEIKVAPDLTISYNGSVSPKNATSSAGSRASTSQSSASASVSKTAVSLPAAPSTSSSSSANGSVTAAVKSSSMDSLWQQHRSSLLALLATTTTTVLLAMSAAV